MKPTKSQNGCINQGFPTICNLPMVSMYIHESAYCRATQIYDMVQYLFSNLLDQEFKAMMDYLSGDSLVLETMAASQDRLGWDCFIGGHITKVFLEVVRPSLSNCWSRLTPKRWCCNFVEKLLLLTHKQLLFWNSHVHYKKLEGMTTTQHAENFEWVWTLMWTDPGKLLAKHGYLLGEDFEIMVKGSTGARLRWFDWVGIESSPPHSLRPHIHWLSWVFPNAYKVQKQFKPTKDGSLVYRRRRRRKSTF